MIHQYQYTMYSQDKNSSFAKYFNISIRFHFSTEHEEFE